MLKYRVIMSDYSQDKTIIKELNAESVFDAINKVTELINNPNETKLIEAYPID